MTTKMCITANQDQKIGFIYAFFASFSYATMASMAKLAVEVSPPTMIFFRNFICCIMLLPIFLKTRSGIKTKNSKLFTLRIFFGFFCLSCFYYAAKHMYIVDSVLLINTSPLFIPIVIYAWDRVKIPKTRIFAIVIGFIGVLFILKPTFDFFNFTGIIGLGAGVFMALSMVTLRKLSKTEPTEKILFYFFTGTMVLSFIPMVIYWKSFENPIMWLYLLGTSVMGFIFQFLTTKAYTHTSPTRVSVISYLAIVISGIYGWVFWGNIPDYKSIIGALFVVIGGVLVIINKSISMGRDAINQS